MDKLIPSDSEKSDSNPVERSDSPKYPTLRRRRVYTLPDIKRPCVYRTLCAHFVKSLELPESAFRSDDKYNMCYCEICHDRRGDSDTYKRGFPEKTYTLPIGWVRISLEVPRHKLDGLNVDRVYHVAFHGTLLNKVEDILNNGCLLAAGDVALGGIRLGERKGHFNDERKPEGFDTKQIFVSPSIKYAGHGAYASSVKWTDKRTGISYNAKVCFQVWIRPDSYAVGPQTLGKDSVIDEHFSNDELEWFTTEKPAVIPYGLLVKLESTSDGSVTAYSELLKVLGDIRPKPDEPRTDRIIDRIAERCTIC